jgi:hypothetical protein
MINEFTFPNVLPFFPVRFTNRINEFHFPIGRHGGASRFLHHICANFLVEEYSFLIRFFLGTNTSCRLKPHLLRPIDGE